MFRRPSRFLSWVLCIRLFMLSAEAVTLDSRRYGEADHPGPCHPDLVYVGTSNPSGFRQKEHILAQLGPGIWQLSETQLSTATIPSSCRALRSQCRAMQRDVRVHTGAGAPTRSNSDWAGSWSGVLTASDFPSRPLSIPWEDGACQTGRVQIVQHFIGHLVFTTANVYGFASGYTFPDAQNRTELLLSNITRELVIGGRGARAISGDFNHDANVLDQIAIWRRLGWAEVQEAANCWWGRPVSFTCKGVTQRDFIFLSPEALAMLREVHVQDDFAEHSTVIAGSPGRSRQPFRGARLIPNLGKPLLACSPISLPTPRSGYEASRSILSPALMASSRAPRVDNFRLNAMAEQNVCPPQSTHQRWPPQNRIVPGKNR